jgi:hypothetical protein
VSLRGSQAALTRRVLLHPESLMCALALDPSLLSRNRNFALYTAPAMRRSHARAVSLRCLARDIASWPPAHSPVLHLVESERAVEVVYHDASLALTRRVPLDPLETALLKVLVARRTPEPPVLLRAGALDLQRVREALSRIGIELCDPPQTARCA